MSPEPINVLAPLTTFLSFYLLIIAYVWKSKKYLETDLTSLNGFVANVSIATTVALYILSLFTLLLYMISVVDSQPTSDYLSTSIWSLMISIFTIGAYIFTASEEINKVEI